MDFALIWLWMVWQFFNIMELDNGHVLTFLHLQSSSALRAIYIYECLYLEYSYVTYGCGSRLCHGFCLYMVMDGLAIF